MFRSKEIVKFKTGSTAWKRSSNKAKKTKACINQTKKDQEKEKAPLSSDDLLSMLKNCPNFLGVYAVDEIHNLCIHSYPAFFILNIMERKVVNGHWIALRVDKNDIEIFDSLGCAPENWGHYPLTLFTFLQTFSLSHTFIISPLIQSSYSHLCGYYCVYYILLRRYKNFGKLLKPFSRDLVENDLILCDILSKYIYHF